MAGPGLEKFTMHRPGYLAVLKAPGTAAMLQTKADAVRAAAEARLDPADGIYILASVTTGRTRAGATIIGVPMRLEARKRILGGAIDAAR